MIDRALKIALVVALAWIALELHGIKNSMPNGLDYNDVAVLADRLRDIAQALHK